VCELDRTAVHKQRIHSAYSALVLAARSLHDLFYELYFLLAKKLTEAADALYGTLSHMLVFSQ
jgi:hypothetical protein